MNTSALVTIDPLALARSLHQLVVFWGGTQDIAGLLTAASIHNSIVSYCNARRSAGFRVTVSTILPRSNAGLTAGFEAERQQVNADLVANWSSFADGLIDVAADPVIGQAGSELNTTYYSTDRVHMTNAGYAIVASIAAPIIRGLL